jgi:hypothetical protein
MHYFYFFQKMPAFLDLFEQKRQKSAISVVAFFFFLASLLFFLVKWSLFTSRIEIEEFYQPKYDRDIRGEGCTNELLVEFYKEFGRAKEEEKVRLESKR